MSFPKFKKDPDAVLDYTMDWSPWLVQGDTIVDATATGDGLTIESTDFTTTSTTVWLSGGTAGTTYDVVTHITTAGGRQDDRTIRIDCRDL